MCLTAAARTCLTPAQVQNGEHPTAAQNIRRGHRAARSADNSCTRGVCCPAAQLTSALRHPPGEKDISDFFIKYGEIESVEVLRGRDKQPRGFGFVIFKKTDTVKKLVTDRFFEIGNRPVEVRAVLPSSFSSPSSCCCSTLPSQAISCPRVPSRPVERFRFCV